MTQHWHPGPSRHRGTTRRRGGGGDGGTSGMLALGMIGAVALGLVIGLWPLWQGPVDPLARPDHPIQWDAIQSGPAIVAPAEDAEWANAFAGEMEPAAPPEPPPAELDDAEPLTPAQ